MAEKINKINIAISVARVYRSFPMYEITTEQKQSEILLKKQGFRFQDWIPASPDADGNALSDLGCMVMKRKNESREINPDGSIN